MRSLTYILVLVIIVLAGSCGQDTVGPTGSASSQATLIELELESSGKVYSTFIDSRTITLSEKLPFGTRTVIIKTIETSGGARSSVLLGDALEVNNSPITIEITAENNQTKESYSLVLEVDNSGVDLSTLLFEEYSATECGVFATIDLDELKVENNLWNAGALPPNSFSQCVYTYDANGLKLMGWQWDFPDDAFGVNAFPQLIYGWKPWQRASTTQQLPRKVSDIGRLKVTYSAEVTRNSGDYNLAFDNWINSASNITPQNIQFEFMIWEDANNLVPFGDFQENVTTSNGTYRFYMGEPDWEPEGSNWTYIAFQRTENRLSGTVDIDELLTYLVNKGILDGESYLASLEFGNEVGNSTGETIITEFAVDME